MDKINIGDTILIVRMDDDGGKDLQAKSYDGKTGVVESIDSLGQIHGTWGGLALIPGTDVPENMSRREGLYVLSHIGNPFRKVMAGPCPQGPASPFIRRNGHWRISSDATLAAVPSMWQRQDSPTREAQ